MSFTEIMRITPDTEAKPLIGISDLGLYSMYKQGLVERGTTLEVVSSKIPRNENGKGAAVVLLHSEMYPYITGPSKFEHLFLSSDERIQLMKQNGLTYWRVTGKISEEEIGKRSEEIAKR